MTMVRGVGEGTLSEHFGGRLGAQPLAKYSLGASLVFCLFHSGLSGRDLCFRERDWALFGERTGKKIRRKL